MPTIGEGILAGAQGIAGGIEKKAEREIEKQKGLQQLAVFDNLISGLDQAIKPEVKSRLETILEPTRASIASGEMKPIAGFGLIANAIKLPGEVTRLQQQIEESDFEKEQRDIAKQDPLSTVESKTKLAQKQEELELTRKSQQGQKLLEGGISTKGIDFDDPDQLAVAFDDLKLNEIDKDLLKDELKGSRKQLNGLKSFGTAVQLFNEALPANGLPVLQRLGGPLAVFGAETGIVPNPELLALQDQLKTEAISLVKSFGEAGNLTEQEQKNALKVINSSSKTGEERNKAVKIAFTKALSKFSVDALSITLKDMAIVDTLAAFNVPIPNLKYLPEDLQLQILERYVGE